MSARCIACGDHPSPRLRRGELSIVRSPGCGLEWREPLPDAAELAALYGGGYQERWGAGDPASLARVRAMKRRSHAAILDVVTRELDSRAAPGGACLLDVGCASGFLLELAEERGFRGYGLDLDPQAVARAQRRFGPRVRRGSLDADAFPGQRFDVVTLVDVFEHLPQPGALLAEARRRLGPDGVLAAVMPNADSLVRRLLGGRWPHYAAEHLFYWTPRSLERFLADRGFRIRLLRTGFRKTFCADYLRATAACVGSWLPPGLGLLGGRLFTAPTGEMLLLASPARRSPASGGSPAAAAGAAAGPG